jgi:PAS domain S-box-containing protein
MLFTVREVPAAPAPGDAREAPPEAGEGRGAEEARARLAAIIEGSDAAIIAKDLRGTVLTWNEAAERLLGFRAEEIIGRPIDEIIPPERRHEEREILDRVVAGERVPPFGTQRRRQDGSVIDVSITVSPIRDREGRIVGASKILRDATDRQRAQQAARTAEARLRAVVENLPTGLIVAELATEALHWNREALAIHGYTADQDQHKFVESLVAEHDLRTLAGDPIAVVDWPLPRLLAGGTFRDYELLVRNKRLGWEKILSYSGVMIRAAGAADIGLLAIEDITARKRAEAAVRKSEEAAHAYSAQLEAILDCVADGLIVYDREGRTLRSTPAADELLGVPLSERERPVEERVMQQYEITAEDGRLLSRDEMVAVRAAVHGETIRGAVLRVRSRNGPARWLRMNAIPYLVEGRHVGAVLSMTDVTDRKQAEQALRELNDKLREADRRKDEFLGMLSHELRNPLAPIRNALYILERAEPASVQARRAKEVATRQIRHLTRLVDDLLDVTRIARGKIQLHKADLDAAALVRRTAEDYRTLMVERRIALSVDELTGPLVVHGDETRLAQVLGNLLQNAAKFTPAGGRVNVAIREEGGAAVIRVRDTGAGIEPALLESIFDPFTQAKQTLARSEGGLGLGLALVKGLATLHGGEVSVSSEGIGRGSEFVVRIPLARAREAAVQPPQARAAASDRRRRVLVVDDNRDGAETLAELVRMLGHDVETAFDGPTALEKARGNPPDVVLCDIGLPGMDGYEVARALRSTHDGRIRLVAVSGYAQPEDLERAAEAGFDEHIAKPPDPAQIESVLAAAGEERTPIER